MSKIKIETLDGKTCELKQAYGLAYPYDLGRNSVNEFAEHIQKVKQIEIRDDDVFLATYPKSGTHWTWEIIVMLRKGSAEYEKKSNASALLDFTPVENVDRLPSPRTLNCHYPVRLIPSGILEKKIKIVHVQRNPKDVVVSFFNHIKQLTSQDLLNHFPSMIQMFMGSYGIGLFYSWSKFVKEWELFSQENPDQILNLFFEDMKEDPIREIKKIDKFLNCNRSDDLINEIAEACSFEKLKAADESVKEKMFIFVDAGKQLKLYRKGEVGDWKNWMTVAQSEMMDTWVMDNLADTQLSFRYSL